MTKIEKLMTNPDGVREVIMEHLKDVDNIPAILIGGYCPSEFGLENHCSKDCEWCWSREVEQKMTVRTGVKWKLQRTPYESEIDIVSDGRVIATVEAGEDKEEIASLIVAAPDMLEALESVLSLIDASSGVAGYHLNGEVATWEELAIREELETAIRKARGEE